MKDTSMLLIRVLVAWVKEALEALSTEGKVVGTSILEWRNIRETCMSYVQMKRNQHRFDGTRDFNTDDPPTFDMLEDKEVIK